MAIAGMAALTVAGIAMTMFTAICKFLIDMAQAMASVIKEVGDAVKNAARG